MTEAMTAAAGAGAGAADLHLHRWPCSGPAGSRRNLVLVHGWGSDSRTWEGLRPALQPHFDLIAVDLPGFGETPPLGIDVDALLDLLADRLPKDMVLLGWSLGGMLATAFAARYPERVSHLITLATNASFISRPGWPRAMAKPVFRQFSHLLRQDPQGCRQRFAGLQASGDERERYLLKHLRGAATGAINNDWYRALDCLGELDNRPLLKALDVPTLHLLGERDVLVPAGVAPDLQSAHPGARVEVLPGVAHLPHLTCPADLARRIIDFVGGDPYRLEKRQVAASFGRAAPTYDSVAHLQRASGEQLLARLESDWQPRAILDLGCGTGLFADCLQQIFPAAACVGLDLAEGMVRHCAEHRQHCRRWLCGDAESLPLADASIDLVYSNFTLQWCQDLNATMVELARVMRPGGRLVAATLGPASLWQLRRAWQAVDGYTHVNRFPPIDDLKKALAVSGLQMDSLESDEQVRYYNDLGGLTRELKALGAHNVNAGRNAGLTGRRRLIALKQAYEGFRTSLGLPASWEFVRVMAFRP